jgi:uncharacterized protein YecT (DUF1311 family)
MWRTAAAIGMACSLWNSFSYADWVEFGAGARCVNGESFTVLPTVELSSDDPAAVPLGEGFDQLGENSRLACRIGAASVEASISAFGPAASGMCMGGGYVAIDSLRVNGVSIFGLRTPFNWRCDGPERMLTKVEISDNENGPIVEVCDAKEWDWGKGYSDVQCHRISFAPDGSLNRTYKEIMAGLAAEERRRLRSEQRSWVRARDDQCRETAIRSQSHGGSPLQFAQCLMSATEQRIEALRNWQR